ncbi:MAG TPA: winged helix-turn-helix transcriptional regulator, partial [Candidatus Thermoplasmatota archaeon]|nr:winged helix-turn-helix transcriptional regulator [Candidatus Thermoplasmatota archaeon]
AKMVPGLERAPDGRHYPTDGVGSSLAYGLEDAIRNVGADPTLASYQSWVAANPRRVLVGALFGQGIGHLDVGTTTEMDRPQHTWTLAFGVPGGGAYVVESKRDFDTGAIANWDSGEARIRGNNGVIPMDVHNLLPERPITLAQAQRFLRGAWGPAVVGREGYDPSQVWWGYPILSARFVLGGADSTDQRPQVTVYDGALQELGIARGKYWPSRAPGSDPGRWDRLLIGVDSGILSVGWSSSTWYNYEVPARAVDSLVHPSSPLASGGGAPAALADRLPLAGWAATSAFVLFLFAYFYPFLKFTGTGLLGAFPGYAKLHKSDLLNNKVREQMLQLIKADPGITPPQLQAHVQAGWSTVVYHLGVLEKNQLVSSLIDGRHKRFFPVGEIDHGKRGVVAALKNERTKQLYEIVLEEPGVIQKELIRRLGISQPSTMWHVKRLEAVGLLGHDKQKREVHYFANPKETLVGGYDPKAAVEVA